MPADPASGRPWPAPEPLEPGRVADVWVVAALLVTPEGRYLFQLRDDRPGLMLRGHWVLFGGRVEPGEAPEAAIAREIQEELAFAPLAFRPLTEWTMSLPRRADRIVRRSFYVAPIDPADPERMVLREGAAKALFTPAELAALPRIAPWDLAAVQLHRHLDRLFA